MIHGDFEVSIDLIAPLDRVRAAYRDPALRASWARLPGRDSRFEPDFRPGGVEVVSGTFAPSGRPDDDRTRLTHHEQYALVAWTGDGTNDQAHLAGATRLALNRLASVVEPPV